MFATHIIPSYNINIKISIVFRGSLLRLRLSIIQRYIGYYQNLQYDTLETGF